MNLYSFDTPLGRMALAEEGGAIRQLYLPGSPLPLMDCSPTGLLKRGQEQILEYLAGQRQVFDLPLAPQGTPFQQKVWEALKDIPYGQTRSYRDIAQAVGCPRGFRAVGMANHRNPIPILIPCHRVVGANGALTGYAGGLALKQALLALEERQPGRNAEI